MTTIQFSHSNGFPAKSYTTFLQKLPSSYDLQFVNTFGTGKYPVDRGWEQMTRELEEQVKGKQTPIVGLGHSLGAVLTLKLAAKHPEYFKGIIVIEPPLFFGYQAFLFRWAQRLGMALQANPLAKRALSRRNQFQNKEEAFQYFREKRLFKSFHPDCLQDYLDHGLKSIDDTLQLTIPREVESQIFMNIPTRLNWHIPLPIYFLYSEKFPVLTRESIKMLQTKLPEANFIPLQDGGHMYPLEKPQECAQLITKILHDI